LWGVSPEDLRTDEVNEIRGMQQVAGLLVQGIRCSRKSNGQLQISGSLLWKVFNQHEPGNLLLRQTQQEVMQEQLELTRLRSALQKIRRGDTALPNTSSKSTGFPPAGGRTE
tara:strand:- start:267 stop:602 length:336 start_codon:yes stop_codon:yes gene_type:complete